MCEDMIVGDVMGQQYVTASETDTVGQVIKKMLEKSYTICIITSAGNVALGIFSMKDAMRFLDRGRNLVDPIDKHKLDIGNIITQPKATKMVDALALMSDRRNSKLVIVDGGHVSGVLTMEEAIKWWLECYDSGNS